MLAGLLPVWGHFSKSAKLRTASPKTSLYFRGQDKYLQSGLPLSGVPGEMGERNSIFLCLFALHYWRRKAVLRDKRSGPAAGEPTFHRILHE